MAAALDHQVEVVALKPGGVVRAGYVGVGPGTVGFVARHAALTIFGIGLADADCQLFPIAGSIRDADGRLADEALLAAATGGERIADAAEARYALKRDHAYRLVVVRPVPGADGGAAAGVQPSLGDMMQLLVSAVQGMRGDMPGVVREMTSMGQEMSGMRQEMAGMRRELSGKLDAILARLPPAASEAASPN